MFTEEEKNDNKSEQSKPVLTSDGTHVHIVNWKRLYLLGMGLIGLIVISFLVDLTVLSAPKDYQSAIINDVSYIICFAAMISVLFVDYKKIIPLFKKWQPYVFGLIVGGIIIGFTIAYSNFVNLFYEYGVNDNETSIRSTFVLYPVLSFIVVAFVGPICEELTYRVGLFALLKKFNIIVAYAVTAVVFAFIHFSFTSPNIIDELVNLPVYFINGLILTFAYHKFGFIGSATAHMTNNLYASISILIMTYSK